MNKTAKVICLSALAVILAAGFFLPAAGHAHAFAAGTPAFAAESTANAAEKPAPFKPRRPYDVNLTLACGKKTWRYNLLKSTEGLSPEQLQARAVYASPAAKRALVSRLVKSGYTRDMALCYVLPGFGKILRQMRAYAEFDPTDTDIKFDGETFTYTADKNGVKLDRTKLVKLVLAQMSDVGAKIDVPLISTKAAFTLADAKNSTVLRGSFSTAFYSSGENRSHNIALAMKKINTCVVEAGDTFSFNLTVGPRDEAHGFRESKVIIDREYTDGVGGGVCQVSTTLYNAVLLADLKVTSAARHSLVSSYIEPSFDASVNYGGADLRFVNNSGSRIYIGARVEGRVAKVQIYGVANKFTIKRVSEVTERVPFETQNITDTDGKYADKVTYTDETAVIKGGSDKVVSKGYLYYYRGEKLVEKRQIRSDTYASAPRVIVQGSKLRPAPPPEPATQQLPQQWQWHPQYMPQWWQQWQPQRQWQAPAVEVQ